MYDLCDVLKASYGSADIINHVFCDYGDGSMGNGIRKFAGQILTVASKEGYEYGFTDGHNTGMTKGVIYGSVVTVCFVSVIASSAWCINKSINYWKAKKEKKDHNDSLKEESRINMFL